MSEATAYTLDFENRTRNFIESRRLLHGKAPVLVALSGGADSVALLAVLCRLGYDCRAAHCNFHLRGEESMRDMRHCKDICERLDVDLYIRDFDVSRRMEAYPSESVEMACRNLRYEWFANLLDREGAQALAVGHHSEDRVETFILNLMRGAGITGLTSMNVRNGSVVRPLQPFTRDDIERYLDGLGLGFITDSSNASDAHRRNRIRNRVMPLLEELFPGAGAAILRSIFNEAIEGKRAVYCTGNSIAIADMVRAESEARTILFELLRPLSFTYTQVCDMLDGAFGSGAVFRSTDGAVVAELSHGVLELVDAARRKLIGEECYSVNLLHDITEPLHIAVTRHPVADFRLERLGAKVAYVDSAALEGGALWELRHYRRGDRMVPFGSHKSKLVSDIFAGLRYSASQKREAWILTRNDEIVWMPGVRNSALFAIGPDTREYLRLELLQ